jgi:hypothetical protein
LQVERRHQRFGFPAAAALDFECGARAIELGRELRASGRAGLELLGKHGLLFALISQLIGLLPQLERLSSFALRQQVKFPFDRGQAGGQLLASQARVEIL